MEPGASSTDVLFNDFGVADMRLRRIAAELAQGAPLPQQIPALVELHLECAEAPNLLRSELTVLEESMLLLHQTLDIHERGGILLPPGHVGCSGP